MSNLVRLEKVHRLNGIETGDHLFKNIVALRISRVNERIPDLAHGKGIKAPGDELDLCARGGTAVECRDDARHHAPSAGLGIGTAGGYRPERA
jgi:hypothetical protein